MPRSSMARNAGWLSRQGWRAVAVLGRRVEVESGDDLARREGQLRLVIELHLLRCGELEDIDNPVNLDDQQDPTRSCASCVGCKEAITGARFCSRVAVTAASWASARRVSAACIATPTASCPAGDRRISFAEARNRRNHDPMTGSSRSSIRRPAEATSAATAVST